MSWVKEPPFGSSVRAANWPPVAPIARSILVKEAAVNPFLSERIRSSSLFEIPAMCAALAWVHPRNCIPATTALENAVLTIPAPWQLIIPEISVPGARGKPEEIARAVKSLTPPTQVISAKPWAADAPAAKGDVLSD